VTGYTDIIILNVHAPTRSDDIKRKFTWNQ